MSWTALRNPSVQGMAFPAWEPPGKRTMSRIGKLVQAKRQDIVKLGYQEGLQAMWEDRWSLLGPTGRADWFQRHGAHPPAHCPLLTAPVHGIRRCLRGGQQSPFGITLRRIRAAL